MKYSLPVLVCASLLCPAQSVLSDGDVAAPTMPAFAEELVQRSKRDQEVRKELVQFVQYMAVRPLADSAAYDEVAKRMEAIDKDNTNWLKDLINQHGWPTRQMVGSRGVKSVWLIVQHATHDVAFQRRCLDLMARLPPCEVAAGEVALLTDRVLLAEGNKQKYGTQYHVVDGKLIRYPVEDETRLDEIRLEIGLPTVAEYEKVLREVYFKDGK